MKGRALWRPTHWFGCRGYCPGCQVCLSYNLWHQFCHCGSPATGYRAMSFDGDVEFFCDAHFQNVPSLPAPSQEPSNE